MTQDQATADGTASERDEDQERRGEQPSSDSRDEPPAGMGITDDDMAQIRSFLQKQRHSRSADDLRPSSDR